MPGRQHDFNGSQVLLGKLKNVEAERRKLIAPTHPDAGPPSPSPITGGTISPTGTAGTVQSSGGLKLVQNLPLSATRRLDTTITLGGICVDLAAKTVTVEVIAESNAESPRAAAKSRSTSATSAAARSPT